MVGRAGPLGHRDDPAADSGHQRVRDRLGTRVRGHPEPGAHQPARVVVGATQSHDRVHRRAERPVGEHGVQDVRAVPSAGVRDDLPGPQDTGGGDASGDIFDGVVRNCENNHI